MTVKCKLCGRTFSGRMDGQISPIDELADHHNDEHSDVLESILEPEEVSVRA